MAVKAKGFMDPRPTKYTSSGGGTPEPVTVGGLRFMLFTEANDAPRSLIYPVIVKYGVYACAEIMEDEVLKRRAKTTRANRKPC